MIERKKILCSLQHESISSDAIVHRARIYKENSALVTNERLKL